MVRDSTDCLIEARGAECVSHAKTLLISVPGFATRGGEEDDLGGWERC